MTNETGSAQSSDAVCLNEVDTSGFLRRILKSLPALNVIVSWSSNILLTAGTFVLTPALLHALGDHQYGIWLLITSYVGYLRILDLGMTAGCMKFSAGYYEKNEPHQLARVFNSSLVIFSGASALSFIMTLGMTWVLPAIYPSVLAGKEYIIFGLGLSLSLELISRPFAASIRARSYFFIYDCVEIVTYLAFKLSWVLYLCYAGISLWNLTLVTLVECVVRNLTVFMLSRQLCAWTRRTSLRDADREMFYKLLGYSGAVFLISVADVFRFGIDNAVIAYFMRSADAITVYQIGYKLLTMVAISIGVIGAVLIPKFSGLAEAGKFAELRSLLRKSSLVTGLLTSYAMINIAVFGLQFLRLWIRKPWVFDSYIVMLIALIPNFIALLQGPACGMLFGMGKLRSLTIITFVEAGLNFALSVALAGPLGIFGVVLGTAIPMLFIRGVVFPWIVIRELEIPPREYAALFSPTLLIGLVYSILICGFAWLNYHNFIEFALACLASTLIYGVCLIVLVPEARAFMTDYSRRWSRLPGLGAK